MSYLTALILAIVEGITEFLPISSTAHLILTSSLLGISQTQFVQFFEIFIQTGAILAVLAVYLKMLFKNFRIWILLVVSFIPTGIVGLVIHKLFGDFLFSHLSVIAFSLVVVGIIFILVDKFRIEGVKTLQDLSYKDAFIIGLIQALAAIPGVSRSGAVILGLLFLGYKKTSAVEYSFLLGLPTITAAGLYDAIKIRAWNLNTYQLSTVLFATLLSFISALVAVKWLIKYVKNHGLGIFGYYRVFLGLVVAIALVFGGLNVGNKVSTMLNVRAAEKAVLYVGEGCPHCKKVEEYLKESGRDEYVVIREVYYNRDNAAELSNVFERLKVPESSRGVPFLVFGDRYFVGEKQIIDFLKNYNFAAVPVWIADSYREEKPGEDICFEDTSFSCSTSNTKSSHLTWLAVTAGALVDAINPCAFAVLILLLMAVGAVNKDSKKSLFASGLSFVVAVYISYFLMGLGILKALSLVSYAAWIKTALALLALILGLLNLKDFIAYKKFGFVMEVPFAWRDKLKALIKRARGPRSAFAVGLGVSLFLLPCTSGPYIVILGMLRTITLKGLIYLLYYNFVFVLPMLVIVVVATLGYDLLKLQKFREKNIRVFHLIEGLILIALALIIYVTA